MVIIPILFFGQVTERLSEKQCIRSRIHKGQQIVIARHGLLRFSHHTEVRWKSAQTVSTTGAPITIGWLKWAGAKGFLFIRPCNDDTIQLQITHCLHVSVSSVIQSVEQLVADLLIRIFAYTSSFVLLISYFVFVLFIILFLPASFPLRSLLACSPRQTTKRCMP